MNAEDREKLNTLCKRISDEQNPKLFDRLLQELNELLEEKRERISTRETQEN